MQFNEIFSNTEIDESIKGEAIKQGAKKAAKYAKVMGKKAINKTKKYLKQPATKGQVIGAALVGSAIRGRAEGIHRAKLAKKQKNESLIEKLDRVNANLKATNEINLAAAGNTLKGVGKSAVNSVKNVAGNIGNTAKTVGGAIKKHPVRTAAIAGGIGAGYLGYKGAKKAVKAGKSAYNDWKV